MTYYKYSDVFWNTCILVSVCVEEGVGVGFYIQGMGVMGEGRSFLGRLHKIT